MSDIFANAPKPPPRLTHQHIEEYLLAMRTLLYDAAGITGDQEPKDLRIAQIVRNLGDCYRMEDAEYVAHVWEACDCRPGHLLG